MQCTLLEGVAFCLGTNKNTQGVKAAELLGRRDASCLGGLVKFLDM